jgi:hypothetical protein
VKVVRSGEVGQAGKDRRAGGAEAFRGMVAGSD